MGVPVSLKKVHILAKKIRLTPSFVLSIVKASGVSKQTVKSIATAILYQDTGKIIKVPRQYQPLKIVAFIVSGFEEDNSECIVIPRHSSNRIYDRLIAKNSLPVVSLLIDALSVLGSPLGLFCHKL